jgi:hypothetical protein
LFQFFFLRHIAPFAVLPLILQLHSPSEWIRIRVRKAPCCWPPEVPIMQTQTSRCVLPASAEDIPARFQGTREGESVLRTAEVQPNRASLIILPG